MNRRMVFHTVGLIVLLEAVLLLLPTLVALSQRESCLFAFLISVLIAAVFGGGLILLSKPRSRVIYAKEGFAITSLAWFFLSVIGAVPFYLSGQIASPIDAFFETVSGFTTTGASILTDVEALDRGLLFWRAFTHWIGGMGVLVFLMAFLPNLSDRTIHIIRAEMPGPTVGKLLPKLRDTAKILYLIYVGITALEVILLLFGGMNLFDALLHSFSTAGTGGFGNFNDSIASFSPYCQWVIGIFMMIFGVNFNLYYLILAGKLRTALRSVELWVYFAIVAAACAFLCADLAGLYQSVEELLRHSFFQVTSVISTTGFSTVSYTDWPVLSQTVLVFLMFFGACAGSTAGGIKISRVILFFKNCHAEFRHLLHPRSVNVLRMDGKKVEQETRTGVSVYLSLYVICLFCIWLLITPFGFDLTTNFTAAVSCFNNVGFLFSSPDTVHSFGDFPAFSKIVLSFAMLLGRLEIWPILLSLNPAVWLGKRREPKP